MSQKDKLWKAHLSVPTCIIPDGQIIKEADYPHVPIAILHPGGGTHGVVKQIRHAHLLAAAPMMRITLWILRREIRKLADQIVCPKDNVYSKQVALIDKALAATSGATAGTEVLDDPWISVEDDLPDEDITVLIANNLWDDPVSEGYLDNGVWHHTSGMELLGEDQLGIKTNHFAPPTHWMHFPEPPARKDVPA